MDIFTFFPWLHELLVPAILVLIGVVLIVIGSLIPFIGGKIRAVGILTIVLGILWYLIAKFFDNLFIALPGVAVFGIVLAILLGLIALIVLGDKK